MNDIYPLDIWYIIFRYCDLLSKIKLISVCSIFNDSFFIANMFEIPRIYKYRLTETILKQIKFRRISHLDIQYNKNIRNISLLTNLKKLKIHNEIDQCDIQELDLIELRAYHNKKINDISFMTNLKTLCVLDGQCVISQQNIHKLNLIELYAGCNYEIKDVSFMTNLKILHAIYKCGINQMGIQGCNLTAL